MGGLILGVTPTRPDEIHVETRTITNVPMSWCVATSGRFYANRSVNDHEREHYESPFAGRQQNVRLSMVPNWHRRKFETKVESVVRWPPAPEPDTKKRTHLDWSVALNEEETLGMLVTPLGGVVVTVNGRPNVSIPDAGVPVDGELYLLVEAYN